MLRLVELEHELTEPESSLSRPPRRRMIDVTFADAPVDVHWVAFENYYTASVTVLHTNSRARDPQARTVRAGPGAADGERALRR